MLTMTNSRRTFLKTALYAGGIAAASPTRMLAHTPGTPPAADGLTILFQGDSITDGNRGRTDDPNHIMGHGYAFSIASRIGADFPERHIKCINKGISGNTVQDLATRWDAEALALKPDVISILIGVNNVLFALGGDTAAMTNFEPVYRQLLDHTRQTLPKASLVLGNPFILPVGRVNQNLTAWTDAIKACQTTTQKLATEFNAVLVDYQTVFTAATKRAPAEYWIWDGIHPTVPGHELMAREWIKKVKAHKGPLQFIR